MNKLPGTSADILADNIAKIKQLFPEVFNEDKIDFERLQEILGEYVEDKEERYRFEWNGKSRALRLSQTPSTGTLRPRKEESKDWDTTENLYIEGDNLEVLKLLQKTYHNRIKMVYIDPPYNTGGDFVYKDDFKDNIKNYFEITGQTDKEGKKLSTNSETSGRYHTDWLNMMYSRLRLARNLLTDDGVIFISIDGNELGNIIRVGNQIFGELNQVGIIANINNPKGRSDDKFIATAHEYILVYAKLINGLRWFGFAPTQEVITRYNKVDTNGRKYREIDLRKTGENDLREDRPNLFYYFYYNERTSDFYPSKENNTPQDYIQIKPQRKDGKEGNWRWGLDTAKNQIRSLIPKFMPARKVWGVMEKDYLDQRSLLKPTSAWTFKDVNSERGSEEFINLDFDKRIFPKPKPIGTISRCIKLGASENDIILDFFSGSATTAHAILQLNAEDGGNRKFIMVQLPEPIDEKSEAYKAGYKNICEIGKERIRRAGEKIKKEMQGQQLKLGEEPKEVPDIGFKVFKLDSSNLKKWNPDYENLESSLMDMVSNYVDGRTEEDVLYEIMLKYGIDLTYPIETEVVEGKQI
ncbi:MAG: site-specific DNA-methyltransferase, partial [Peptostreptococcales bacterium]